MRIYAIRDTHTGLEQNLRAVEDLTEREGSLRKSPVGSAGVAPLTPGVVQIWRASISEFGKDPNDSDYAHLLSADEIEKYKLFKNRQAKLEFLLGRIMIRTLLSRYCPSVEPWQWTLSLNSYGKPLVENFPIPIDFSLSHSGGFVVTAFVIGAEVGIDIECARENLDLMDLASSVFSPTEIAVVRNHVGFRLNLSQAFYSFWTLKEAYIKACGMGLSIQLDKFTFRLPKDNELPNQISISFDSGIADDPNKWWFAIENYRDHALAIALKRDGKPAKILQHDYFLTEAPFSRSG